MVPSKPHINLLANGSVEVPCPILLEQVFEQAWIAVLLADDVGALVFCVKMEDVNRESDDLLSDKRVLTR